MDNIHCLIRTDVANVTEVTWSRDQLGPPQFSSAIFHTHIHRESKTPTQSLPEQSTSETTKQPTYFTPRQ